MNRIWLSSSVLEVACCKGGVRTSFHEGEGRKGGGWQMAELGHDFRLLGKEGEGIVDVRGGEREGGVGEEGVGEEGTPKNTRDRRKRQL